MSLCNISLTTGLRLSAASLALTLVAADGAMAARAKDAVEACKLAATAEAIRAVSDVTVTPVIAAA